ncbi:MAG: pitrilysin family protein [Litorilinea sp.]
MRKLTILWIASLILPALLGTLTPTPVLYAQTSTDSDAASDVPAIDVADYALDVVDYYLENGLRVVLAPDASAPVVTTNITYRVGSADDPEGRSGFAHLFEHLMFGGTENIEPGTWDLLLDAIGAQTNAYITNDKTVYWMVASANHLPRLLWMESDRLAALNLTQEAVETEVAVIVEEYNQRVANPPYGQANQRLFLQAMAGWFPYERAPIGLMEELTTSLLEEVIAFHDRYYVPNNATLVIAGDIDVAETQALVQAYFGPIPAGEPVSSALDRYPMPAEFPILDVDARGCAVGTQEVIIDAQAQIPRYALTVVGPPVGEPDFYALDLLTSILSSGRSSRIEQNILEAGLAASAFAGLDIRIGGSLFYAAAYPNMGEDLDPMLTLLHNEIDQIRAEGVTAEELNRAKTQTLTYILGDYRSTVRQTAEWLQDYALAFGEPDSLVAEWALYEAVTLEDIQRVAQEYLCDRPASLQKVLNSGEAETPEYPGALVEELPVTPEPVDAARIVTLDEDALAALPDGVVRRTEVPDSLGDLQTNFPDFETFQLDNGLEVIFVQQSKVPQVQLQMVVGGSEQAAPADKQGVVGLMVDLITKGTFLRSGAEIAETIESAGGSISASAALEWTVVAASVPTPDTRLAFTLLADVVRRPTFPQREFEVSQARTLTFLQQDAVDPDSMANRQFSRVAFQGHPYGYLQTPETAANLTRDDVRAFHRTFYRPGNALLIIVGDLTLEEAQAETARAFRFWAPGATPDYLDYPEAEPADTSVIYLVDRPGAQQSTVQVGNLAINARHPDRYALEVVNTVLGSGFSSRLMKNLRQDKGYTYGVYSRFARPNDRASFRALGAFDPANTANAVQEILYEMERMRSEPISEDELAEALGKLEGNFALSLETPASFASQLATRRLTGVPIEELNTYMGSIAEVSPEMARAAAEEHISAAPIIIVVGDVATLLPQLEALGPVQVVDGDGQVIEMATDAPEESAEEAAETDEDAEAEDADSEDEDTED